VKLKAFLFPPLLISAFIRMYTSTFSDWFCQAVIDFMLGNRTASVFSEFLLKLKSTDPRDLIQLSRIRAEAIATSVSHVLPEGELLLSGWTLFAPERLNTKMGMKFEEKVLLLVSFCQIDNVPEES
jgi:phosphatidylinositol 4-phosphatase